MPIPDYTPKDAARFWSKVAKSDDPDECWLWNGYTRPDGRGTIYWGIPRQMYLAYRVSFLIAYGEIPDGMFILHSCGRLNCVNPRHLLLGRTCYIETHDLTDIERFWSHVDKSGGEDACWIWTAYKSRKGYGIVGTRGAVMPAHRLSWMLANEREIPEGFEICHNCPNGDNKSCVNPKHLYLGTHLDNMRDVVAKGQIKNPTRGIHHWKSKLSDSEVQTIRARFATGEVTQTQLGKEFGVSQSQISHIVLNKSRRKLS